MNFAKLCTKKNLMLNNYKTNKQSTSSKICKKLVSDIKNYVNKDLFIQNIVRKINLSTKVPNLKNLAYFF